MSGFRFDLRSFDLATRELQKGARKNTEAYGKVLARTYESDAKRSAPWVDRRGNARMHLYGDSVSRGNRVQVEMGGAAPNYKNSALSAKDYMEYLEFDHGGKYAVVLPTANAIMQDLEKNFGEAALHGKIRPKIYHNRKDLNARRRQVLMQTAVQFGWWQRAGYNNWLRNRSVFNR